MPCYAGCTCCGSIQLYDHPPPLHQDVVLCSEMRPGLLGVLSCQQWQVLSHSFGVVGSLCSEARIVGAVLVGLRSGYSHGAPTIDATSGSSGLGDSSRSYSDRRTDVSYGSVREQLHTSWHASVGLPHLCLQDANADAEVSHGQAQTSCFVDQADSPSI